MLDVREPSCCWQASRVGAFGPGGAGDCVPPTAGAAGESASNNPGASHATSADSPNTPVGKQDRKRFCAGDNRDDVGAGRRFGYKQLAADDRERLEDLLTIMAMAIVYQKLPGEVCNRFILSIGWGLLLVKLPKAMLFLAATNTRQLESPINPLHRGVE